MNPVIAKCNGCDFELGQALYILNNHAGFITNAVFCPGLKKGMVLPEGKGHFRARNYILRALLRAELHFEGTFVRGIVIRRKKIIILLVQYSNHIFG